MAEYSTIPASAKLEPKPFKAHVSDQKLEDMKQLLKLSPIGKAVYENTSKQQGENHLSNTERRYGMRQDWLSNAKDHWLNSFDWRKQEDLINSFPNFTVQITDGDGIKFDVHFMALFSEKPDAIPLAFYHGWPGSFMEFLKIFGILKERYSPKDLPFHVIAPSLPGFGYSSGPPVDVDYATEKAAVLMHNLMIGLGFESGYLSQGGDIGSFIARHQAAHFDACKSMHVNLCMVVPDPKLQSLPMDDIEKQSLPRGEAFRSNGMAYAMEHGTRTGTIGLTLSASPLAMLSWIGEKFLEWTDDDPALDEILASVSLYWLTDCFPSCIYGYRGFVSGSRPPPPFVDKPSGFSFFPKELLPCPKSWAETSCNLVAFSQHQRGGHFAVGILFFV